MAKTTPTEQSRRFIEAAKKLGANTPEEAFDRALRKVASAPPAPMPKRTAGKGRARVGKARQP